MLAMIVKLLAIGFLTRDQYSGFLENVMDTWGYVGRAARLDIMRLDEVTWFVLYFNAVTIMLATGKC